MANYRGSLLVLGLKGKISRVSVEKKAAEVAVEFCNWSMRLEELLIKPIAIFSNTSRRT